MVLLISNEVTANAVILFSLSFFKNYYYYYYYCVKVDILVLGK